MNYLQELDQKITAIQRSTQTLVPGFIPVHDRLRQTFPWYYHWHLSRWAKVVHVTALAFVAILTVAVLVSSVLVRPQGILATLEILDPSCVEPPTISNVRAEEVGNTTASIRWTTSIDSDSKVDYGTTDGYGSSQSDASVVSAHSIALTGLGSGTYYHYKATSSCLGEGLQTASSSDQHFTTTGGGGDKGGGGTGSDTTAPTISAVTTTASDTTATVTWTTNEAADSTVEYGLTKSYGSTRSSTSLVTSHSISLTGLAATTTYQYRVKSRDAAGNLATTANLSFATTASPSATVTTPMVATPTQTTTTVPPRQTVTETKPPEPTAPQPPATATPAPEPTPGAPTATGVVKEIRRKQATKRPTPPAETVASVVTGAAAVATATSAAAAASPATANFLLQVFSHLGFTSLLARRRRARPWGEVSDEETSLPVDGAHISLIDTVTSRVVGRETTDQDGRFLALPERPGTYQLKIEHRSYRPWQSGLMTISDTSQLPTLPTVVLHPTRDERPPLGQRFGAGFVSLSEKLRLPLLTIGTIVLVIALIQTRSLSTFAFTAVVYLLLWGIELALTRRPRPWGVIVNTTTKQPVDRAIVRLIQAQTNRLVRTIVTSKLGRFHFLAPPGEFYMVVTHPLYQVYQSHPIVLTNRRSYVNQTITLTYRELSPMALPRSP